MADAINIFPDDIAAAAAVSTCASGRGEEVGEVLGGKASKLQQLLQRQCNCQMFPTHSGENRVFFRPFWFSIFTRSSSARICWILLTSPGTGDSKEPKKRRIFFNLHLELSRLKNPKMVRCIFLTWKS